MCVGGVVLLKMKKKAYWYLEIRQQSQDSLPDSRGHLCMVPSVDIKYGQVKAGLGGQITLVSLPYKHT